jgi:hypothetical protein
MHHLWQTQRHTKLIPSLNRPRQTVRVVGAWGSQISRQSGKVCQLYVPAAFTAQKNIPGTNFCYSLNQLQRYSEQEGLNYWKIPMPPTGIKPATFRLVPQCFKQTRQRAKNL